MASDDAVGHLSDIRRIRGRGRRAPPIRLRRAPKRRGAHISGSDRLELACPGCARRRPSVVARCRTPPKRARRPCTQCHPTARIHSTKLRPMLGVSMIRIVALVENGTYVCRPATSPIDPATAIPMVK